LLPAGVTAVSGDFTEGDPVEIIDADGNVIARGLINFDAADVPSMLGKSTKDIVAEKGEQFEKELVHRDNLVLISRSKVS
jgi:glutamate 5-kinase